MKNVNFTEKEIKELLFLIEKRIELNDQLIVQENIRKQNGFDSIFEYCVEYKELLTGIKDKLKSTDE
jgi:hypothetical protein